MGKKPTPMVHFSENAVGERNTQRPNRTIFSINTKLLPLKLLIFLFYGGMSALYPFLTIHMKSLGLTITETAVVYALLPILCFVGPAVTGWAADKLGNYKIILISSIILNILLHTLLFFGVPSYSVTNTTEPFTTRSVSFSLPCRNDTEKSPEIFTNDFLNFPEAETLGCRIINATYENHTEHVLHHLEASSCLSTCKTSTDVAGNVTVCLQNFGCIPIGEVFSASKISPAEKYVEAITVNAECLKKGGLSCSTRCALRAPLPVTCYREVVSGNKSATFWLYFVFRVLASIALAAICPLLDAATIQMTIDYGGNIGLQRMYSLLATCIWAPVAGVMIDKLNMGYAPAFYVYDGLHVIAAVLALFMSLNVKLPAENIWKNVGTLLKNPKVVVFIFVVFFIGAAWGLLDSFLFWFMEEDLKSPKWLLGLTNTVGGICGIPVVAGATWIIKKTGHTNILIFAMFIYGIRYLGYSFVYNAYNILPLEALEAFTNSLMWVTATIYAAKIAPNYLATLQGIVGGMHYGIGRGAGSLIGGLMIRAVGARQAWRTFAYVCFACGLLYAALQYFWLRKLRIAPQDDVRYNHPEKSQQKGNDVDDDEGGGTTEETDQEEAILQQVALFDVIRGTSSALSGSMINLRKDEQPITNRDDQTDNEELESVEDDEVFGYDERQTKPYKA